MRNFLKPGGLRAFAGEIAIVVLGVGIALGAGEMVDDWNWQKKIKAQKGARCRRPEHAGCHVGAGGHAAMHRPTAGRACRLLSTFD